MFHVREHSVNTEGDMRRNVSCKGAFCKYRGGGGEMFHVREHSVNTEGAEEKCFM